MITWHTKDNYVDKLQNIFEVKKSVVVKPFTYRRNKPGEFIDRKGKIVKAGYYGPKTSSGHPILLEFGIWDKRDPKKYEINEPMLVGIDITRLRAQDVVNIAGPYEDGKPTGDYLKTVMSQANAKSRYQKFIQLMDTVYGSGYGEKVLHKGGPQTINKSGSRTPHGSWRTYVSRLATTEAVYRVTPDEFLTIASKLKSHEKSSDNIYKLILQKLADHGDDEHVDYDTQDHTDELPPESDTKRSPNLNLTFAPAIDDEMEEYDDTDEGEESLQEPQKQDMEEIDTDFEGGEISTESDLIDLAKKINEMIPTSDETETVRMGVGAFGKGEEEEKTNQDKYADFGDYGENE